MSLPALERLLADQIGLNVEAIGRRALDAVLQQRMAHHALASREEYFGLVLSNPAEREELVEAIVVPETWFFRDTEPFRLLARHVAQTYVREPQSASRKWRVLSVPCATGEEAYSAAIALADAGVPTRDISVTGVDISQRSLAFARNATFSERSFRRMDGGWWKPYFAFTPPGQPRQVTQAIRDAVRFVHGNAIDSALLLGEPAFDFVFCRNLLIYLTNAARKTMAQQFKRWLRPGGLLFLGHAEAADPPGSDFRALAPAGAFAFIRGEPVVAVKKKLRVKPAPIEDENDATAPRTSDDWEYATLLADRGQLPAAADLCERLLVSQGPSVRGYCLLGVVHQAAGRHRDAEICFTRALELDPDHHESLVHMMLLCERDGRRQQAASLRSRVQLAQPQPRGGTP